MYKLGIIFERPANISAYGSVLGQGGQVLAWEMIPNYNSTEAKN